MSNWWQNLNMTPQERKFVIGVVLVFAIVLNFLFIWPQFGKWSSVQAELQEKRDTLAGYEAKIAEMPKLKARLSGLETSNTSVMVSSDAKTDFRRTVERLAQQYRFNASNFSPPSPNLASTNKYFQELSMKVSFVNTGEKELVNFLYKLSDGNSSIRVRDFSIKPNQPPSLLNGFVTLVANYEVEKPAGRTAEANKTNLTAKSP